MATRRPRLLYSEEEHIDYPVWEQQVGSTTVYTDFDREKEFWYEPVYNWKGELINEPFVLDGHIVQVFEVVDLVHDKGRSQNWSRRGTKRQNRSIYREDTN